LPKIVLIKDHIKAVFDACVQLGHCTRGATAILFAILIPTVLLTTGGAIDYLRIVSLKTKMQSVADGAVLLSARAITVAQSDEASIKGMAAQYVKSFADSAISGAKVDTSVDLATRAVKLTLSMKAETYFDTPFMDRQLTAVAKAQVIGQMPVCVLGLDDSLLGTVTLRQNARLTANGCAVYSNSTRSNGITVDTGGQMIAGLVCSAGGGSGSISPSLTKDCPIISDPLAGRTAPASDFCDETDHAIGMVKSFRTSQLGQALATGGEVLPELRSADDAPDFELALEDVETRDDDGGESDAENEYDQSVTISPGVYCGGLLIGGNTDVFLQPGIYVMKDGPLYVSENARIVGTNVGFYFTGNGSTLFLDSNTSISLSAPTSGALAGLLFFEDPAAPKARLFSILSDDARELTGTIYLPNGTLVVDADRPIADHSAYTAIVARRLALYAGPNLVLNTNYHETDVPVAADVQYNKGVRLVE
jgi:putative Flp pilus-assembly TadE/G-like protein